ncbi:MAG TPA: PRC-barrel domain-containing protein [Anaerolineales bacterium]|nr:PRC-barrel domain-containing protein [Anaerolineales bacterium]
MRLEKGMHVFTAQGEKIGTLSRVVIDARTRDVTDIVVERGAFTGGEKVIPIGLVDRENDDRIQLRETNQGVDDFLEYETTHFVALDNVDEPYENIQASFWYPPTNLNLAPGGGGMLPDVAPDSVPHTETSIPEGRITISQGAQVFSSDDKHLGNVDQVVVDANSNQLTHFVIGKGFLFKEHRLVPAQWIERVSEDKVYLAVAARLFDRLPDHRPD